MKVINPKDKLALFSEHWNPKIVGELNGQYIKLAKLKGEFVWHAHENEDEMFYILSGTLKIEFRDKIEIINPGEFIIIPKGVEHKPVANEEVEIMLFEPKETLNTGKINSSLTKTNLDWI